MLNVAIAGNVFLYFMVGFVLALFCSYMANLGSIWGGGEGLGVMGFLLILFLWPVMLLVVGVSIVWSLARGR